VRASRQEDDTNVRLAFRGLVLVLPLIIQGCVLDIAPTREPLDAAWESRMLAGEYGTWLYGEKTAEVGRDEVDPSPPQAGYTRYGIRIREESTLGGGGWWLTGGMIARVERPGGSIELFGKELARLRGLKKMVGPRDISYEFFLVARPTGAQRGRLVRQWRFSREALADRPPSDVTPGFPEIVRGSLSFDAQSKTATVTITGLVRPFQEAVDVSHELP